MEYVPFEAGSDFTVQHLSVRAVDVNHKVPASGFLIFDGNAAIALTGDTAGLSGFWQAANNAKDLAAVLIECAFPDELSGLAQDSHHLTPSRLKTELAKIDCPNCPIYIVNIKPMYREQTIKQIEALAIKNVEILEVGRMYEW
jgi:hypothetical protein